MSNWAVTEGISLRDYFAIHATDADIKKYLGGNTRRSREEARYAFADAMLKQRERSEA